MLRIANDLVRRGVLIRGDTGYALGPELSRLGEQAALQQSFARYTPLLEDLHGRFGGIAWITAGNAVASVLPVNVVCAPAYRELARARWPQPDAAATLTNTAGGRVVLAHRSDLLARVERLGITPATRNSPRTVHELHEALHRVRGDGLALESEQNAEGWSCAAAAIPNLRGHLAVVGVIVQAERAHAGRMLAAVGSAFEAMVRDTCHQSTVAPGSELRRRL